ncbi:MAG: carbohydrate-binding family 9-like protein [Myxococcales bacterium]|nr:carbohydrate-binding family 9-like protein [Myxococcales bacterium]
MANSPLSRAALLLVAFALLLSGCKSPAQRARVLTKDQEQQIAANVLKTAPKMQHERKIDFEDRITLLGYDLNGTPTAGGRVELVMYFKVNKPVTGDWKIFVHFEAPGKRRQPFDHYGVGELYPVAQWKKGEIIKDKVSIAIPKDWPNGKTQLLVGFFDWGAWSKASQNRRLKLAAGSKKAGTPDDRALVTTVDVTGGRKAAAKRPSRPKAPAPTYQALKLTAAPTLDGKLDEWTNVRPTAAFKQPDGRPLNAAYETTARIAYNDTHLFIAYETKDDDIKNSHAANDSTLWEGDVVEMFVQPKGSSTYYEFQWAPNKATFDAKFTGHRKPKWEEAAKWNAGGKHAVALSGTANADGGDDKGWTVEAQIPFSALGVTPKAGDTWTINLYRIDSKGTHNLAFMGAWAPVGGDFHGLKGAAQVTFAAGK